MSSSDSASLPPIRVQLPDGQELVGQLHERRCWQLAGWMYLVGLPMWATDPAMERVEPREYRVWLTAEQAQPLDGVSYEGVPTYPLPSKGKDPAPASDRWGWKVQRVRPQGGRPGVVVVHVWDCEDAPSGGDELNVFDALEVLRSTAGAVACKECGAAVALGPLLESS